MRIKVCCDDPGGFQLFDHATAEISDRGFLTIHRDGACVCTFNATRWTWFDNMPDVEAKPKEARKPEPVDNRSVDYFGQPVGPKFTG